MGGGIHGFDAAHGHESCVLGARRKRSDGRQAGRLRFKHPRFGLQAIHAAFHVAKLESFGRSGDHERNVGEPERHEQDPQHRGPAKGRILEEPAAQRLGHAKAFLRPRHGECK